MIQRNFFILSIIIIISLGACQQAPPPFECTDTLGCVTIAPNDPLKIGILVSNEEQGQIFELVIAQREQLLGHPIEALQEDSLCSPEGGANSALKVVADPQTVGILGTTCSSSAATAGEIMTEAGLVMISGLTTGPSLTSVGGIQGEDWQPGFFRTSYNGATMAEGTATFASQELGLTKAAILDNSSNYSTDFADGFKQRFVELGGEIVLDVTVDTDDDMRPVLTAISASGAEVVYIPLFTSEAIPLITQKKDIADLENTIFIAGDALLSNAFLEGVADDGLGLYFPDQAPLAGPANDKLISEFNAYFGHPPTGTFYRQGFDAGTLLLNAIETVAIQDEDGSLHLGRQALRDALYATSNFDGISGRLSCDEFGDCGVIRFNIVRWDDSASAKEDIQANVIYTYNLTAE